MQIFWVSSAVGQIKSINITFKKLVVMFFGLVLTLIALGIALQFFGFRMAIEYDPAIARKLGNLHTAVELENLHALYGLKLDELNEEIELNRKKINELVRQNKRLSEIATPLILRKQNGGMGQGGPFLQPPLSPQKSTLEQFSQLSKSIHALNKYTQASIFEANRFMLWLESKPTKSPLHGIIPLASEFGKRIDPINARASFHQGIDLATPAGTPFFASAKGRVIETSAGVDYGNQIIIAHGDGLMTRYAHLQSISVKKGTFIKQGELLGTTGNTGRSTGPHLHFEVIKNGERIDPLRFFNTTP